jgi:sortase A
MFRNGRKLLSLVLIAFGAVLLFLGAREFIGSIKGQREAARRYEESRKEDARRRAAERPAPPELGEAVARLSIPRLESSWFVLPGVGKKELRAGPGHVPGSAMPGTRGNALIAAHRDTHFRVLKDIQKGDVLVVETRQGRFRYKVQNVQIVKPTNTKVLQDTAEPVMKLITCYPFYYVGPAPMRFIVEAELAATDIVYSPTKKRRPS